MSVVRYAWLAAAVAAAWVCCGCEGQPPDSSFGGGSQTPAASSAAESSPAGADSGGSSSSSCTPTSDLCRQNTCGEVFDACGGWVACGTCGQGRVCTTDLRCCEPITSNKCDYALPYGTCGWQPDGCGGAVWCDKKCGEGDGFLTCKNDGHCHCIDAAREVGYTNAYTACLATQYHYPAYCWGKGPTTHDGRLDIPADCHWYGSDVPNTPYQVFCCGSPQ